MSENYLMALLMLLTMSGFTSFWGIEEAMVLMMLLGGFELGVRHGWEVVGPEFELELAALGNLHAARNGVGIVGEERMHLL